MIYKFFDPTIVGKIDDIVTVKALRKKYPNCYYKKGIYKNEKGFYALSTLDKVAFGDPVQLNDDGIVFFGALDKKHNIEKLGEYETNKQPRIEVELVCGVKISIFPASAIPKKIYLRRQNVESYPENDMRSVYNVSDDYGFMAFNLFERSSTTDEVISATDPKIIELVDMALTQSYNLPIELFDDLEIFSEQDLVNVANAAMGISPELQKKTIEDLTK